MDAITSPPVPVNEPVRTYAPGSAERATLAATLSTLASTPADLTMTVDGVQRMAGGARIDVVAPHRHDLLLGVSAQATVPDVEAAIGAALQAAPAWRELPFDERAAVFLRAAELLSTTWRDTLNAATMLGQSKTAHQAEIDSVCELADFFGSMCTSRDKFLPSSRSVLRACGTAPTTGRSRGSCWRSRRSTSPRSPATCRRRRRCSATSSYGSHRRRSSLPRTTRCGCSKPPGCRRV